MHLIYKWDISDDFIRYPDGHTPPYLARDYKPIQDIFTHFKEMYENGHTYSRENYFFTIGHCEKTRKFFTSIDYFYVDLDHCNLNQIEEYILALSGFLGVVPDQFLVVVTGRGLQIYLKLTSSILRKDFIYFFDLMKDFIYKFNDYCFNKSLPFDVDTSVYADQKILRLPDTINNKPKEPIQIAKAYVYQPGNPDFYLDINSVKDLIGFIPRETNYQANKKEMHFKNKKCIEILWNKPLTTQRHYTFLRLIMHEKFCGTSYEECKKKVEHLCKISNLKPEYRGYQQLKDCYNKDNKYNYDFGCNDSILSSVCVSTCENPFMKKKIKQNDLVIINNEERWIEPQIKKDIVKTRNFSLDIFSETVAGFIRETARLNNTHPEFVAIPLLIFTATLAGRDFTIKITDSWEEKIVLWGMNVGEPGSNKTFPINHLRKIMLGDLISKKEEEFKDEYKKYSRDREHIKIFNKTIKAKIDLLIKKEGNIDEKQLSSLIEKYKLELPSPIKEEIVITTPTPEALSSCSDKSPHLTIAIDEISRLFEMMKTYPQLDTLLLECADGAGMDNGIRKSQSANKASNLYVNLIGSIQPDRLKYYFNNRANDGFIERLFLIAYPNKPTKFEKLSNEENKYRSQFDAIVKNLQNPDMLTKGATLKLTDEAMEEFNRILLTSSTSSNLFKNSGKKSNQFISKMPRFIVRVASVLCLLRWAEKPFSQLNLIEKCDILNSEKLFEEEVLLVVEEVNQLVSDRYEHRVQKLKQEIISKELKEFTISTLRKYIEIQGFKRDDLLKGALSTLCDEGFLIKTERIGKGGGYLYKMA